MEIAVLKQELAKATSNGAAMVHAQEKAHAHLAKLRLKLAAALEELNQEHAHLHAHGALGAHVQVVDYVFQVRQELQVVEIVAHRQALAKSISNGELGVHAQAKAHAHLDKLNQ